jgi:transposase-like protein
MALDGRRTKAAALLGGGVPANRVAAEVGINARQLRRWRKEPDFAALESASRGDVLAGSRTLHNVLEAALVATTPKGAPDWSARLKAAHLLISSAAVLEELEADADEDDGPSRRIVIHRPDLLPPGELERPLGDGAETMIVEHE